MIPNPLVGLTPINSKVAVHQIKDVAMAGVATKFIGVSAAPKHVPSSTRQYALAWGNVANTGEYQLEDIVMVSGSGPWRGVTLDQIHKTFKTYYTPLLEVAAKVGVTFVVGTAKGTDQLVVDYLETVWSYVKESDKNHNFLWLSKKMKTLECHTKGDEVGRSFSPFNCYVEVAGVRASIEDHYQSAKVFRKVKNGKPTLIKCGGWEDALRLKKEKAELHRWSIEGVELRVFHYFNHKGKFTLELKDFGVQFYAKLWHLYLVSNQHKIEILKDYDAFRDPFGGTFPFTQASVLALVKEKGLNALWEFSIGLRCRLIASEDDLEIAESLASLLPKHPLTPKDWQLADKITQLGGQEFLPNIYMLEVPF